MKKPADQQRNAERIPLENPIDGTLDGNDAKIIELSLIGAKVEHFNRVSPNSNGSVQFAWKGKTIKLRGKIARTEMQSIRGKLGYISGITFADSAEKAPKELTWIMSTFVESIDAGAEIPVPPPPPPKPAPPPPPPKLTPAAPPPAATAPIKAMPQAPKPAPKPAAKAAAPAPITTTPAPFLAVDDEVEELDASSELPPYVQCVFLENGGWENTRTTDPKQPISGFTMLAPETDSEVDDFCRTYEMADPETQRMIRLSFELSIAQFRRK